ncbi:MAG: DUF502 domain-containing protein [Planctomycetota bacterium]
MKKLLGYFVKGLLFVAPVVVTIYVIWIILAKIDRLSPFPPITIPIKGEPTPLPGVGVVVVLALITLIGFLASNIFTRWMLNIVNNIFRKLPLVKLLYTSLRDLIGAFVGDKKIFDKPVLVKLWPESETKVLGFMTRESLDFLSAKGTDPSFGGGLKEQVAVYLPQSYNFSGNLMIVHRSQVILLNKDSAEVMTFIVSAGVSGK